MEYIVILDPDSRAHSPIENMNGFLETYSSYDSAKIEAEEWKENGDCRSYKIYGLCSDERNHII